MCHDGDEKCEYAASCTENIRIMTNQGTAHGANTLQWSKCSARQFQETLKVLTATNQNCLEDEVQPEPIHLSSYPGQRRPPEASYSSCISSFLCHPASLLPQLRCHDLAGACGRHVPDKQAGHCRAVICTVDNDFTNTANFSQRYLVLLLSCRGGKDGVAATCPRAPSAGRLRSVGAESA